MFHIYKTLIQLCKKRTFFQEFERQITAKDLDDTSTLFMEVFQKYFLLFPDETVQLDSLIAMMLSQSYSDEKLSKVSELWPVIQEDPTAGAEYSISKGLAEIKAAAELSGLILQYESGEEVDLYIQATDILDQYGRKIRQDTYAASDRWEHVQHEIADPSKILRLPLTGLQAAISDLTTKEQIIVAARPDRGKTSFCSFLGTAFVAQEQTGRPILVLNNEGSKDKWMATVYRVALGKSKKQLLTENMRKVQEEYDTKIGRDRFLIYDIHGQHIKQCERLIQKHKPFVVFWDMLDNVRGYDDKGKREDQRLEMLYQRARELANEYDFLSIPTSQLSAEAEGKEYPTMDMLAGSKTAKQGACTAIIMLGSSPDPARSRERFISCPKNKFSQEDSKINKGCYQQVWFEWETARFKEAK